MSGKLIDRRLSGAICAYRGPLERGERTICDLPACARGPFIFISSPRANSFTPKSFVTFFLFYHVSGSVFGTDNNFISLNTV